MIIGFFLRSLALLAPVATAATNVPLSAAGADIVDAAGHKVQLKCVNWYGAQLHQLVPSGLDRQPLGGIAAAIAEDLSLNCVRLVYALEMVRRGSDPVTNATALLAANPALQSLSYMQVFDATVAALTQRGLVVVLNNHNSDGGWCCHDNDGNGLWYTDAFPEWEWLAHFDAMTKRYLDNPLVAAFDLRNELRTAVVGGETLVPTWGDGNPSTDWKLAAEKGGAVVLRANPQLLVVVEGLNYALDLRGVAAHPVVLPVPNKLVYSAHNYDWSFDTKFPNLNEASWRSIVDQGWLYIIDQGIAPVWLGEFGTETPSPWWDWMTKLIDEKQLDYAYWPLNGEDSFGLLAPDYSTVRLNPDTWSFNEPTPAPTLVPELPGTPSPTVAGVPDCTPAQLHLSPGTPAGSSMWVSWVTKSKCSSAVEWLPVNALENGGDTWHRALGEPPFRYEVHDERGLARHPSYLYALPYESDYMHHVHLKGLDAATHYTYRVGGAPLDATRDADRGFVFSVSHFFRSLEAPGAAPGPMRIAVVGDVGDTDFSKATMGSASRSAFSDLSQLGHGVPPEFVMLVGDLSYADGNGSKWDDWGQMMEPVLSSLPMVALPGNHEIEVDRVTNDVFVHFRNRFRMPEVAPEQTLPGRITDQDSYNFDFTYDYGASFFSFDVGLVHVITLNTYAKSAKGSVQWNWLSYDLKKVDRKRTPWILVFTHGPWYNTNTAHQGEVATMSMRKEMEPLLTKHKVAAVFAGHVHAVERSHPVINGRRDDMGTVYVTIGDGGNDEGHARSWADDEETPDWVAFRNGSHYGRGDLLIANSTHMRWQWRPNNIAGAQDSAWIINPLFTVEPPEGVIISCWFLYFFCQGEDKPAEETPTMTAAVFTAVVVLTVIFCFCCPTTEPRVPTPTSGVEEDDEEGNFSHLVKARLDMAMRDSSGYSLIPTSYEGLDRKSAVPPEGRPIAARTTPGTPTARKWEFNGGFSDNQMAAWSQLRQAAGARDRTESTDSDASTSST